MRRYRIGYTETVRRSALVDAASLDDALDTVHGALGVGTMIGGSGEREETLETAIETTDDLGEVPA